MTIIVKETITNEDCVECGEIEATIKIDPNNNIHGYINAFVLALKTVTFTDNVILKGFKNYVDSEEAGGY